MIYLFLNFFDISRLHSSSVSFFKLSQISKKFSIILIEKRLHISGPRVHTCVVQGSTAQGSQHWLLAAAKFIRTLKRAQKILHT